MGWLLDTNVVSELRRTNADPGVRAWASRIDPLTAHLSAMTVFELEIGVLRKERTDPRQGAALRAWLESVLADFGERVVVIDVPVAAIAARLHVPDPGPDRDAFIAATAQQHGLTVVTRNVKDFDRFGVRLLNPWSR